MAYYVINGGKRLEGSVTISGAKNAALANQNSLRRFCVQ